MNYSLGLNGWSERGHDASACLMKEEEVIAAVEEERFTRRKHAYDQMPKNSMKYCLEEEGITLKEVDRIGLSWDYPLLCSYFNERWSEEKYLKKLLGTNFEDYEEEIDLSYTKHHKAHAESAYYPSNFNRALILVIDGGGEKISTSIWKGEGEKIEKIKDFHAKNSLGFMYSAATVHIGMGYGGEGKTMGLAPWGEKKYNFDDIVSVGGEFDYKMNFEFSKPENGDIYDKRKEAQEQIENKWMQRLKKKVGSQNNDSANVPKKYRDLAASIQRKLEKVVKKIVRKYTRKMGVNKVCIAGGVGLNCSLNRQIREMKEVKDIFIQPAANDAGTALGAALDLTRKKNEMNKMRGVYLGPDFSNKEVEKILQKRKIDYEQVNPSKAAADLLAENKVISWFQGRLEYGPRALGSRSILANPSKKEIKDKVNDIKARENWRPLAPSILEDSIQEYFENSCSSPFMILNFKVRKEKRQEIPAVVHTDGTTRPQTVTKKVKPKYWKLIKNFEKRAGIPLVLNTSFNISDKTSEPIVCTPKDALDTFIGSEIDYLIIEDYMVSNEH